VVINQFTWLRNWVVFSFFTDLPPMRPQNAVLQVLDSVEPKGTRTQNGILFYAKTSVLQMVIFKNSKFVGDKMIPVPSNLDQKLRAYMNIVRPAFGMSLNNI
jgi:hypothetical protein